MVSRDMARHNIGHVRGGDRQVGGNAEIAV
jgi:hypothetical protein